jgi:hypothetical protein
MSFGTGHHQTTSMMLQYILELKCNQFGILASTTLSDLGNNLSEKTGGYLADWNSYSSLRKNKPGETSSFNMMRSNTYKISKYK